MNEWIKLNPDILNDPKLGMLPNNVWRRCIELLLLAGERDDWELQRRRGIAWKLRLSANDLLRELEMLEEAGILSRNEHDVFVIPPEIRERWITSTSFNPGYVYLFQRPLDGAYKIGMSSNPTIRLKQICDKFPGTIRIYTTKTDNMRKTEAELHQKYNDCRVDGEWFTLSQHDVSDITKNAYGENNG